MNKKLVSIIVPVYNTEKYLPRCIDGILNQSHSNIEIILVNDGSVDNSGSICEAYGVKDMRIQVIHKENGGPSEARNVGIDAASGEYITFIDSDDFVHIDYVKTMLLISEKHNCDVVQCALEIGQNDNFTLRRQSDGVNIFDHVAVFRGRMLKIAPCGKLYKKRLFSFLRFPVGKKFEDEFVTYKAIYFARRIAILQSFLYYYYQSHNSVMRNSNSEVRLDFLDAYEERIAFFEKYNEPELVLLSQKELAIRAMLYYMKYVSYSVDVSSVLLEVCRNNCKKVLMDYRVSLLERILLKIFLLTPTVSTYFAKKILGVNRGYNE